MMSKVIPGDRIVPVWMNALEHLEHNGRRDRNLLLEIESPATVTKADRGVIALVDPVLRQHSETNVLTVAGTIFPWGLYKSVGAKELPARFFDIMGRAKVTGHWGTYAMRLMARPGAKRTEVINPLYEVVRKLKKASTDGVGFNSNYELGVHTPQDLFLEDIACELPLYSPPQDFRKVSNYPCLSHLTFKLVNRQVLELTAIYRSHYYAQRALGNLVGLTHLMRFVSIEAGLMMGRLTCISTDAHLDEDSWGGTVAARELIGRLKAAMAPTGAAAAQESGTQMSEACVEV